MNENKGRFEKGHRLSEATTEKMRGRVPWNKGLKGWLSGASNPFYGKHHTAKSIEKNRLAHIGKKPNEKQKAQEELGQ